MYYRRNADDSLRQAERDYLKDQTADNLIAYNRARMRAGLPVIEASYRTIRDFLSRELSPYYWVTSVTGMQFPAIEARFDIVNSKKHTPTTKDEYLQVHDLLMSKISLIADLGFVVLLQQRGVVDLSLSKKNQYGEYVVQWREDRKLIDRKSYYTDDKEDAKATMAHMKANSFPQQYPDLYAVPASIMRLSGQLTQSDSMGGTLVADAWRKDSDPRTITDPSYRKGTYPTAVLLVRTSKEHEDPKYLTTLWRVPYDQPGVAGYRDQGNYSLSLDEARTDYVCRLLKVEDGSFRLYT